MGFYQSEFIILSSFGFFGRTYQFSGSVINKKQKHRLHKEGTSDMNAARRQNCFIDDRYARTALGNPENCIETVCDNVERRHASYAYYRPPYNYDLAADERIQILFKRTPARKIKEWLESQYDDKHQLPLYAQIPILKEKEKGIMKINLNKYENHKRYWQIKNARKSYLHRTTIF